MAASPPSVAVCVRRADFPIRPRRSAPPLRRGKEDEKLGWHNPRAQPIDSTNRLKAAEAPDCSGAACPNTARSKSYSVIWRRLASNVGSARFICPRFTSPFLTTGVADGELYFGDPGDRFIAGDWGILDGVDTPVVSRPSDVTFCFRHTLTQGNADYQFSWRGARSSWLPVAGDFGLD